METYAGGYPSWGNPVLYGNDDIAYGREILLLICRICGQPIQKNQDGWYAPCGHLPELSLNQDAYDPISDAEMHIGEDDEEE